MSLDRIHKLNKVFPIMSVWKRDDLEIIIIILVILFI
jgi:hypothetical protein